MNKLFDKAMDPMSSETHFVGACLSVIGLLFMILRGIKHDVTPFIMGSTIVFGISLIALYSASAIYHYFQGNDKVKKVLRTLDHSMIYVLIVGTYTPVVMCYMEAPHSYYFLGILWTVALIGIIVKLFWLEAPRSITTLFYLILGWAVVFDFQAFSSIPIHCLFLIACGGIAYSVGAVIYIFKKPNFSSMFGFHELFHIFVMVGSAFHFLAVIIYIL